MEWYWDKLNNKIFLNNWNIDPYEGVYLSIISLITPNSSAMIVPYHPPVFRHKISLIIKPYTHLVHLVIEIWKLGIADELQTDPAVGS